MKKLTISTAEPFFMRAGNTGCVLVHGFTGTPKEMRPMGEYLYRHGITSLGIRLAGHATQPSDLIRTRWWDWLVTVEDGINFLSGCCDHLFIAGLSLGGILSLAAAVISTLDGAIAMATPYSISDDWRVHYARLISHIMPFIEKEKSDKEDKNKDRRHVDYPAYPIRSVGELDALLKTLHQHLNKIEIPILLINSSKDKTAPPEHAEQYQSMISSKILKRITLENSGHVITEGEEQDIAFRATHDFIREYSTNNIQLNK